MAHTSVVKNVLSLDISRPLMAGNGLWGKMCPEASQKIFFVFLQADFIVLQRQEKNALCNKMDRLWNYILKEGI